jgi:hypothetical protein
VRRRQRPQDIQDAAALALTDQLIAYYSDPAHRRPDYGTRLLTMQYEIEICGLDDIHRLNLGEFLEHAGMPIPAWCTWRTRREGGQSRPEG